VIVVLGVACRGGGADDAPRLHATVVRPHADTVTFAVPVAAHRCSGGRSLLLQAADERGNGVLALLRYGDSLATGPFALIALGDSLTARGANVAVRYMQVDMAHGLSLDSGSVDLTASGDALGARVRGSGLEGGVRVALDATYQGVPRPPAGDTVPCRFQP
jgi:hypothetical protein